MITPLVLFVAGFVFTIVGWLGPEDEGSLGAIGLFAMFGALAWQLEWFS